MNKTAGPRTPPSAAALRTPLNSKVTRPPPPSLPPMPASAKMLKATPYSPLEQSSAPQPGSHWQVSGETQRPWTHSSVQRAEEEERNFISDFRIVLCHLTFS